MHRAPIFLFVFWILGSCAWGQAANTTDDASKGRHLAIMLCTDCHVVAPDQPYAPTLNPPAASFQSIAQRADITADSLRAFLTTTHQGLDNRNGMPDPMLADFQIKQISAYLLSLRK
jgi:mono/diheme cytochrome c family protein